MKMALLCLALALDLGQVRREPDPNKRVVKAMDYASAQLTAARQSAGKAEIEPLRAALEEMNAAAALALETVKAMRKPAQAAKRAELRSRELLRRLETLLQDLSVDDRDAAAPFRDKLQSIQEELLELSLGRTR